MTRNRKTRLICDFVGSRKAGVALAVMPDIAIDLLYMRFVLQSGLIDIHQATGRSVNYIDCYTRRLLKVVNAAIG